MRARAAVLGIALALLGCSSTPRRPSDYTRSPDRPEAIAAEDLSELRRARAALERGDLLIAQPILEHLTEARPKDVAVAILLQDLQYVGASAPERAALVEAARARATAEPNTRNLLLAARIEPDTPSREKLLENALQLDPQNAWTHYALAHFHALTGNWAAANKQLGEALELDPGHRAARRLEAALVARSGNTADAIEALELWIAQTADDPRISSETRVLAQLDLAQLLIVSHDVQGARDVLTGLADERSGAVRRWCLMAAVEQALGRPSNALDAAQAAEKSDPDSIIPLVQEALLWQHHLHDQEAARSAWKRVLAAVEGNTGLSALIQGLRARVVLERMEGPQP